MKRVAIVTYWYPPLNAIGSLRPAKLAKYLPDFGWEPIVITVAPECRRYLEPPLQEEALRAGEVHRTRDRSWHTWMARRFSDGPASQLDGLTFDNARASGRLGLSALHGIYQQLLAFPDEVWPWLFEYQAIEQIARRAGIAAIVSSSPPATTHLIAARLARSLRVPWVADFRDPWTQRPTRRRIAPLNRIERWIERRTLSGAHTLVTVSDPIARDLERLHAKPTEVLANGFDPEDVAASVGERLPLHPGRFTILHTGTLAHDTHDPSPFFDALERAAQQPLPPERWEVWLVGRNLDVGRRALAAFPALQRLVHLQPLVPRPAALGAQREATVLLILGSAEPQHEGRMTGKVFEYLDARRPILAFATRGGALDCLLRETGAGVAVTSAEEGYAALLHWAREYAATGTVAWKGNPDAIARYHRRTIAGRWAALLDAVTR